MNVESRLRWVIGDGHDRTACAPVAHLTVGGFRDWLLSREATRAALHGLAPGLTPEMAGAVSKIIRLQDLALAASRIEVVNRFRGTIGLAGRFSPRLPPNHPVGAPQGIAASTIDGALLGCGDPGRRGTQRNYG